MKHVDISCIGYNFLTIRSLVICSMIIIPALSNYAIDSPLPVLYRSSASSEAISTDNTSTSVVLGAQQNTPAMLRMHNTTATVSLAGEVKASNLQRPLFKPITGINSQESYLTRNFEAYMAAKNQSEFTKPNTTVFEVKPPKIFRTNPNTSILAAFEGLSQNCCFPPDVQLAAGKKYLVEMVNLDGAIYSKKGTLIKTFALEPFFNPSLIYREGSKIINEMSDPVVLFDSLSGRWFASISDITEHSIRVAVSKTEDPTGIWKIYNVPFTPQPNNCSDQPFTGISKDKLVITVNNWGNDCNWYSDNRPPEFRGVQLIIADKMDLINGIDNVKSMQSESDLNYFSLHPIINITPTTTLQIATVGDFGGNTLHVFYIDGPLYELRTRVLLYHIQETHVPPNGVQYLAHHIRKFTSEEPRINTGDTRILSGTSYQGKLWLTFNDGCFIAGDSNSRSCIRLVQIDTITNEVLQDFDVGTLASSVYYPAISIDAAGNLGVIFGYSSHSVYPSILVSTRFSTDKSSSIEDPSFLKLGTGNELSNRYGDYFAASYDPSNTNIIWVAGEYHPAETWSTYIGSVMHMVRTPESVP